MATQSYLGRIDIAAVTSGTLSATQQATIATSDYDELKYVSATLNSTRNQVDITESSRTSPAMEKAPVLFDWNVSLEFIKKASGEAGYEAQQALKEAITAPVPSRIFFRVFPDVDPVTGNPSANDEVQYGEVIVTAFNANRSTADVVRISVTLEGTGPFENDGVAI